MSLLIPCYTDTHEVHMWIVGVGLVHVVVAGGRGSFERDVVHVDKDNIEFNQLGTGVRIDDSGHVTP